MEEHNSYLTQQSINEVPKRSQFLTALCVLSYIWSGIALLCLFLCLIFTGFIYEALEKIATGEGPFANMDETQQQGIQMLLNLGQGLFTSLIALGIIIYMTSLLGVVKMWKLQKWGFYIYTAVNGFGVIYSIVSGSYVMGLISLVFIIMYYLNLKDMK